MLLCKKCIETKITNWKKPFEENVSNLERIPEYYEVMQHVWDFDPEILGAKLENGEMLEVMCASCKMTHIGKDSEGVIKIRYVDQDWEIYVP